MSTKTGALQKGREIYQVEEAELEAAVDAARTWEASVLPRMAEAARLAKQPCNGTVLTPGEIEREMYRELLRLRQVELTAKQERERIETELKLVMQVASELGGIATWKSGTARIFEEARFKRDNPELYDAYSPPKHTRPFTVRW